ncbi:MAG: hypothetical protein V1766_02845 [Pseudomonadota bacterium]
MKQYFMSMQSWPPNWIKLIDKIVKNPDIEEKIDLSRPSQRIRAVDEKPRLTCLPERVSRPEKQGDAAWH